MDNPIPQALRKVGAKLARTPLADFPLVSQVWRRMLQTLDTESVEDRAWIRYAGADLCVDPSEGVGQPLYNSGTYEPEVTECIYEHTRVGGRVFDVGAHLGHHTLAMREAVGSEGTVYAFEPNPSVLPYLRKTIDRNGFKNVQLIEKAVSDTNEPVYLVEEGNRGTAKVSTKTTHSEEGKKILTVSLAEYVSDKPVNLIKMDIEGYELNALRGLSGHMSNIEYLVMELHKSKLSADELAELNDLLKSFNRFTELETGRTLSRPSETTIERPHILCERI